MTIQAFNEEVITEASNHLNQLTKPVGSLGRLEQLAIQLAGITGEMRPTIEKPAIIVAAADHGIVEEGVSAYPQAVTALMVDNFVKGGAAINVFGRQIGAPVYVVDVGINANLEHQPIEHQKVKYGTNNFYKEDAMSEKDVEAAIEVGRLIASKRISEGHKVLITGEMGIGNTTSSSALIAAFTGIDVEKVVGTGTGIDQTGKQRKITIIKESLHKRGITNTLSPIQVVAKIGGLEIAALTGVILEGAEKKIPVIIDGLISSAAALVASELVPEVRPYLLIAHQSAEPGHHLLLNYLGVSPLLHLNLRLGEGTGAALAYPLLEAASRVMKEMATFKDIGL
ncbi:nicotinate-nucleotide--dimethylbenzimidazole phosphoribosyltransferase [Halalkalibacter urbisdiaboli]|uniref:nicotinate-nucleotide--dimethylbenzimidazole phosphoribosyltransferase n=1 Tax=Halalkalibacter urbisdiaboli TaxID=1960589 RepID=UPI000B44D961|nr:nicotinate-nucleotide--dimethylbenzimidazole phosphoribosyltransferase [Halalkalibacter urbisdiaboli]